MANGLICKISAFIFVLFLFPIKLGMELRLLISYSCQPCTFPEVSFAKIRQLLLYDVVEGVDCAEREGLPF